MFKRVFTAIETKQAKRINLKKVSLDQKTIKQRNLRLGYKHSALAIAGYLEGQSPAWWQEEIQLAQSYCPTNWMLKLFYFYKLLPKAIAKMISRGVNQICKLLRRIYWLQDIIVKRFY